MTNQEITDRLERIASARDFAVEANALTREFSDAGVGLEAVDAILRFMERHPSIDFGSPGPLVHFVERYYGRGYEQRLVESISRKPTPHTVSMLNAVINGTKGDDARRNLIAIMRHVRLNPLADEDTVQRVNSYLDRFAASQ